VHCVQHSFGAQFHPELATSAIQKVFPKGMDIDVDSYSGFFDNAKNKGTGLNEYLRSQGIQRLFIVGLATDYCVKFTCLDALQLGYTVFLIQDACRGVNLEPDDRAKAIAAMQAQGAIIIDSKDVDQFID
jgi:nicotinamidase/pyrazinamidase